MGDNENGADMIESLVDFNKEDWSLYDNLVAGSVKLSRKLFALHDNEDFFRDLTNEYLLIQK